MRLPISSTTVEKILMFPVAILGKLTFYTWLTIGWVFERLNLKFKDE